MYNKQPPSKSKRNYDIDLEIIYQQLIEATQSLSAAEVIEFIIENKQLPILARFIEDLDPDMLINITDKNVILQNLNIQNVVGYYLGKHLNLFNAKLDSKEYDEVYNIIKHHKISLPAFILGAVNHDHNAILDHFAAKCFRKTDYDKLYANNTAITNLNNFAKEELYQRCKKSSVLTIAIALSTNSLETIIKLIEGRRFDRKMIDLIIDQFLQNNDALAHEIIYKHNLHPYAYKIELLKKALVGAYETCDSNKIDFLVKEYTISHNQFLTYYPVEIQRNAIEDNRIQLIAELIYNQPEHALNFIAVTELEQYNTEALIPHEWITALATANLNIFLEFIAELAKYPIIYRNTFTLEMQDWVNQKRINESQQIFYDITI